MLPEQMDACWNDKQKVADLVATFQKNATADAVEGTPTFIIAGEKRPGWDIPAARPWRGSGAAADARTGA